MFMACLKTISVDQSVTEKQSPEFASLASVQFNLEAFTRSNNYKNCEMLLF